MSSSLFKKIEEAYQYIIRQIQFLPKTGIILGTGLGNLTDDIEIIQSIPYQHIPHFPASTVQSHKGELVFGYLSGQPIVAMAGRFHYYEGYSMQQVTFPIRVLKALGVEQLFISNVSGSVNPTFEAGDLIFVKDHINLQPENPLRGENDERLGPRFPDMLETYDKELLERGMTIAASKGIQAKKGVYVALQGPNLETPAEYNFIHVIGGDLVGMSTVPEVLVARHCGLKILVMSIVSNVCYPIEQLTETTVEEVIAVAQVAEPKLRAIVSALLVDSTD